jgi:hypothetical protein
MTSSKAIWRQLYELCKSLHEQIYDIGDVDGAVRRLPALKELLEQIPTDNEAIVGAEAFALYHELSGNLQAAIEFRKREIALIEELHHDVRDHDYSDVTRSFVLAGRDSLDLKVRKEIVHNLKKRINL